MIKLIAILTMSTSILGCIGPRNYTMQDHAELMQHCQLMCDEVGVRLYSPTTGTCKCNAGAK
jgi:hypothetical protein